MKRRSMDKKGKRGFLGRKVAPKKPLTIEDMESEEDFTSISAKKLHGRPVDVGCDETFSYCIVHFAAIFLGIAECLVCRTCGGDVKFQKKSMRGLGFKLIIFCTKCNDDIKTINSSPLINSMAYEINRRFAATMRILGKGLSAMQMFCGLMDLPTCITQRPYDIIMKNVEEAATAVVQTSMKLAAKKELEEAHTQSDVEMVANGIIVSGDGTWMKRGFSSLFGVATLIGNFTGKVVDFAVKSSYCKDCEYHKVNLDDQDFEVWFADHESSCFINHTGSAGKMEPDAMLTMFQRSEELHGVKYEYYIGDGDSKTFSAISNAKPYGDVEVKKKECIGHVQKRNESLNSKIWIIAPKCIAGSCRIVRIASSVAAATYNDGAYSYLRIFHLLGITIGVTALNYCEGNDANRLKHGRIRTYEATKEGRINKRLQKNSRNTKIQEEEGIQYEAGMAE